MRSIQNEAPTVFGDNMNVNPALPVDQLRTADVMDILASVFAMVQAVVIERDHRLSS
jgi:hypothetical protein